MARILVADDDRTTRVLVAELLRAEKFTVVTASDGAEALQKLRREKCDLALLDVWMPKKNGIEILAALRKSRKRTKAIVMTSDDTPQTLLSAIREQAYQYIPKPVEPAALIGMVKQSLEEKSDQLPIQVISARPDWVELSVPCSLEAAERIENFLAQMKGGLPDDVRSAVGQAFHELLLNAIEWGGKLDPKRKVRISYLRAKRMLLYRIADPGSGFKLSDLNHAAISHLPLDPIAHDEVRQQKGLRPGGFGLVLAQANVDELLFNEAQNEVVFVKYLDA